MHGRTRRTSSQTSGIMARLEHVGIAVDDVSHLSAMLTELLGESPYLAETLQADGIRTHFVWGGSAKLELLEDVDHRSAVSTFVRRHGPGLHHLAFEVDDVRAMYDKVRRAGYEPVDPEPRAGAEGKLVFFLHPSQTYGVLIEFCQSVRPALRPERLPEVAGLRALSLSPGSAARPPCLYLFENAAALAPLDLAEQLLPRRPFYAAEGTSTLRLPDLLDALTLRAVHLVASAPCIASVLGPAADLRIRSLTIIDPGAHDVDRIEDVSTPLLVLTGTDEHGLRMAAASRSRLPAARLAATADSGMRAALVARHLAHILP